MMKTTIALLTAAALALAGCGSSGSTGSTGAANTTTGTDTAKNTTKQKATAAPQHAKAAPPSGRSAKHPATKASPGEVNASIERSYGTAGSSTERDQAAQSAVAFLTARAAGSWALACSYLASSLRSQLEAYSKTGAATQRCASALAGYESKVPRSARQSQASVHALSLRVKGDEALLIYRDAKGTPYYLSMRREGGAWKADAVAATPLR